MSKHDTPWEVVALAEEKKCPACGRAWGQGKVCQFCGQLEGAPAGVRLSSPGRRLGAYLLEALLAMVTLGIGYLIWTLVAFAKGQTPGKQALRMRVVSLQTGKPASWGTMFVREFIAKLVIGFLSVLTLGIINFWLLWDSNHQELWDKLVGTLVVDDPNNAMVTQTAPASAQAS